jgi:hypothetical protein
MSAERFMSIDERRKHRRQQKLIMQYLLLKQFSFADWERLLTHLRDLLVPCTRRSLNFKLNYLALKGYVELKHRPIGIGEEAEILGAKITAAGVDALDREEFNEPEETA